MMSKLRFSQSSQNLSSAEGRNPLKWSAEGRGADTSTHTICAGHGSGRQPHRGTQGPEKHLGEGGEATEKGGKCKDSVT